MSRQTLNDQRRIRFEGFEADLRTEELFSGASKLRLPHQSFCILSMLLERAGELVTREELCARLWPTGSQIEYDQRLNAAVNRLREVLLDSAEKPRFIETLPKRGYRFIGAIEPPPLAATPTHALAGSQIDPTMAAIPKAAGESPADGGKSSRFGLRIPVRVLALAAAALVLVTTGVLWFAHRGERSSLPFGRQILPLASLPGKEIAPTFSPDGSQVAFGWDGGKPRQFDLYVKSLGSERLLRLTQQPSRWLGTAWSPDGSTLAFVRETDAGGAGLFLIPALGGAERSLLQKGVSVGYDQISWSPDGSRLAYSGYGPKGTVAIFFISLQTADVQPLSLAAECLDAFSPAFSPDGRQLAYLCSSSSAVYKVMVAGLFDHSSRALASMFGDPQGLTWADGKRLILGNDPGDGGEMWQLTLDGDREQLPFGEEGSAPAVASRAARMAYVRGHKTVDIWRADLSAPHPEDSAVKLISSTRTQVLARYSRDGSRITFQSNRSGSVEIWMTDAQGGDPDRLTSFNGPQASNASWCSDGRRIAFDSRVSGISALYIEDINERVPHKLATPLVNLASPVWSTDCHWLFAIDANHVLYRVAAAGGAAERFAEKPSSYYVVIADRLIFNVLEPDGVVLWSKLVSGGPPQRVAGLPKIKYDHSWAATEQGIYYTDSTPTGISVAFHGFGSDSTRELMSLRQTPVPGSGPGISVSPDGRWLLYGQSGNESSEIMLSQDR